MLKCDESDDASSSGSTQPEMNGPTLRVFDTDYPLKIFKELEDDVIGNEVYTIIRENGQKMSFNYWDSIQDQVSFVVYLSAKIKKDSITHKRFRRLCNRVANSFGVNWCDKPILSLLLVVGTLDSHVSITFRSTWPGPTTPMPASCQGPKSNRKQCPRCKFWNPVNDFSDFCLTCQLFMKSSSEPLVPLVDQLQVVSGWRKVGKDISFSLMARPLFLQNRHFNGTHMTSEIEKDQLQSFIKLQIGPFPTVSALSRHLSRGGERTAEVVFPKIPCSQYDLYGVLRLLEAARSIRTKTSPLRVVCSMSYPTPTNAASISSTSSNTKNSSRKCSSSTDKVDVDVDASDVDPDPRLFRITLRLYVIPSMVRSSTGKSSPSYQRTNNCIVNAPPVNNNGNNSQVVSDDEDDDDLYGTASGPIRGVWASDCHVLCAFLSGEEIVQSEDDLGDSPVKELCSKEHLLRASDSIIDCGGYSDLRTSLGSIIEGICREALRIGKCPPGFGLEKQMKVRTGTVDALQSTLFRYPWQGRRKSSVIVYNESDSSREDENDSVDEETTLTYDSDSYAADNSYNPPVMLYLPHRERAWLPMSLFDDHRSMLSPQRHSELVQCSSLSAVMTYLENLGHPCESSRTEGSMTMSSRELGRNDSNIVTLGIKGSSKYYDKTVFKSNSSLKEKQRESHLESSSAKVQVGDGVGVGVVPGLMVTLRNYQQQTLSWALEQECLEGGINRLISAPIIGSDGNPTGVWFSPITGEFSYTAPADVRGGFICEEMGMGKTIIVIALILSNMAPMLDSDIADEHWDIGFENAIPLEKSAVESEKQVSKVCKLNRDRTLSAVPNISSSSDSSMSSSHRAQSLVRSRATLVVCPLSLVGQWCNELRDKVGQSESDFRVVGYHGSARERRLDVLSSCDVVITTYETLAADLRSDGTCFGFKPRPRAKPSSRDKKLSANNQSSSTSKFGTLFDINWHRIVLDESHKIKSKSIMNEAVVRLSGKRRWCVTGTPVNTKIADFAGQFRFLGVLPTISSQKYWCEVICRPNTRAYRDLQMNGVDPSLGFALMMTLLRRVVMRHSKGMFYEDTNEPLLLLPVKHETICMLSLSADEHEKYARLEALLVKRYKNILRQGSLVVQRGTIKLLSMIKELQMVCSGGMLPCQLSDLLNSDPNDINLTKILGECCICLDLMDDPMVTNCGHVFCADCIYGAINHTVTGQSACPLCRRLVTASSLKVATCADIRYKDQGDGEGQSQSEMEANEPVCLRTATATTSTSTSMSGDCGGEGEDGDYDPRDDSSHRHGEDDDDEGEAPCGEGQGVQPPVAGVVMVSKMEWLVRKLRSILAQDRDAKVLIFSQFNQTVHWLQSMLPSKGFRFRSLSGTMSMQQRRKALDDFQRDPSITLFLLSMRAGAVGVNLTLANHVVVMEPCLNTALEEQAIGRVHRIGQHREVHIHRIACKNSIEERILWSQRINSRNKYGDTAASPTSPAAHRDGNAGLVFDDIGAQNEDLDDMLMYPRLNFNRFLPASSSHPVGALSNDRIAMSKSQYDLLFGVNVPSEEALVRMGIDLQLHPPLDNDSDEGKDDGYNCSQKLSDTHVMLSDPDSLVEKSNNSSDDKRQRELSTSTSSSCKRPRRMSAMEGLRKIHAIVEIEERQGADTSEDEE